MKALALCLTIISSKEALEVSSGILHIDLVFFSSEIAVREVAKINTNTTGHFLIYLNYICKSMYGTNAGV